MACSAPERDDSAAGAVAANSRGFWWLAVHARMKVLRAGLRPWNFLAIAVLLAAFWMSGIRPAGVQAVDGQLAAFQDAGAITVDWPARLRVQDEDWLVVTVQFNMLDNQAAGHKDLFDTHNVVAVGRLEMPALNAWSEPVRQPVRPDRPVSMRWAVRADQPGEYRGVLWVSLELVPLAGGPVETITLLSRPLHIAAVGFLGLPAWIWRWVGAVGLAVSVLLAVLHLQSRLRARDTERNGS